MHRLVMVALVLALSVSSILSNASSFITYYLKAAALLLPALERLGSQQSTRQLVSCEWVWPALLQLPFRAVVYAPASNGCFSTGT
jgi:hypothetical protein